MWTVRRLSGRIVGPDCHRGCRTPVRHLGAHGHPGRIRTDPGQRPVPRPVRAAARERAARARGRHRCVYSKVRAITRITGGNRAGGRGAEAGDEVGASDDLHSGPAGAGRTTEDEDQDVTATPAGCITATRLPTTDQPPHGSGGTDPTSTDPADREDTMLALALAGTASHVEAVVRATRRRQTDPLGVTARRSLSWRWEEDGSLVLRGRFTPDEGAALIASLEALVPPAWSCPAPGPGTAAGLEAAGCRGVARRRRRPGGCPTG